MRVQSAGHAIGISKALSRRRTAAKRTRKNRRDIRLRKRRAIRMHRYARQDIRFHGSSIRPRAWGRHLSEPSKGLIIILSQITGKNCDEFTTIRDPDYSQPLDRGGIFARAAILIRVVDRRNDREERVYRRLSLLLLAFPLRSLHSPSTSASSCFQKSANEQRISTKYFRGTSYLLTALSVN